MERTEEATVEVPVVIDYKDRYTPYIKATHTVMDLETLGVNNDCVVMSIGAVRFSETAFDVFYRTIDIESAKAAGFNIEPGAVKWWLQQSPEARAALFENNQHILDVLMEFTSWMAEHPSHYYWGNAPDFDFGIINYAINKLEITPMDIEHFQYRDIRTLCVNELVTKEYRNAVKKQIGYIAHHALHDATLEARVLARAIDLINTADPTKLEITPAGEQPIHQDPAAGE